MKNPNLALILEALLITARSPIPIEKMQSVFDEEVKPSRESIQQALDVLQSQYEQRSFELKKLASGYCLRTREVFSPWIRQLQIEKPSQYSKALLETLAVIAYRQPVTRGDIENIRGVAVSTTILKTLLERAWIKTAGQRDIPGRPTLYKTTHEFLDYFNLSSLQELPPLPSEVV